MSNACGMGARRPGVGIARARRDSNPRPGETRKLPQSQEYTELTAGSVNHGDADCSEKCTTDANLARVIAAWPTLSAPIRTALAAMVEAARGVSPNPDYAVAEAAR